MVRGGQMPERITWRRDKQKLTVLDPENMPESRSEGRPEQGSLGPGGLSELGRGEGERQGWGETWGVRRGGVPA